MKEKGVLTSFLLLMFLINLSFAQYEHIPDHPAIKRYKDSKIVSYERVEFDEFYFPIGDITEVNWSSLKEDELWANIDRFISKNFINKIEGRIFYYAYSGPQGRSTYELFKNYEKALIEAGYVISYKEEKNQNKLRKLASFFQKVNHRGWGSWEDPELHPWYYLSATSPQKDIYIALAIAGRRDNPSSVLYIIEPKALETGLTSVEMLKQIKAAGHISIYGIYFDFDKAEIKPESEPVIKEIAKFLKENPEINLYVVGHTDNIGKLDYNLDLSKRRAIAVVKELVEKYGIKEERLRAFGVGPLAPVASNRTEEGRAKNRRVELVEW